MRKICIIALSFVLSLVAVFLAIANNLELLSTSGMTSYGNALCGPIPSKLDGVSITGGVTCDDISTTTYVPGNFDVTVSTLDDFTSAKFYSQTNSLFKYEEAAWLLCQMSTHPGEIGEIQFAVWRLFNTVDPVKHPRTTDQIATENAWLAAAGAINPADYNFSSVRIYTAIPPGSNQEFMSGCPSAVPLVGAILLLGSGLACLAAYARRRQEN